jgi:hypothetical protein
MYGVKQDLTERQSGRRVDRARVMTKLYKMAIQLRDSQRVNASIATSLSGTVVFKI